jgi:hypothetical protein
MPEYRTFTYSERGYRKLLREAGYPDVEFFWADPGYNQPYELVNLSKESVRSHFRRQIADPTQAHKRGASTMLKKVVSRSGLFKLVVPEFVMITGKGRDSRVGNTLNDRLGGKFNAPEGLSLTTHSFGRKTIVLPQGSGCDYVLKVSPPNGTVSEAVSEEAKVLGLIASRLGACNLKGLAPDLILRTDIGKTHYVLESKAPGYSASSYIFSASFEERQVRVAECMRTVLKEVIALNQCLKGMENVPKLNREWTVSLSHPAEVSNRSKATEWVHHGDLTVENAYIDPDRNYQVTLIDWEHASSGAPAVYDVVTFLLSMLSAIDPSKGADALTFNDRLPEQFCEAFFVKGKWGMMMQRALNQAYTSFAIPSINWFDDFLNCITIRAHYHDSRNSGQTPVYKRLVELTGELRHSFMIAIQ